MKLASVLAVAAPSLLVGAGLGWSFRSPSDSSDVAVTPAPILPASESPISRAELTADKPVPRDVVPEEAAERPPHTPLDEVVQSDESLGLFSPALLAHARQGIVNGWHAQRRDDPTEAELEEGFEKFKEATLALPSELGSRLAIRRAEEELALEDARTGGVMMTLGRLENGGEGPLMGLVRDRATFDQFFVAEHSSAAIEGPAALSQEALENREPVKDGSTLIFSAGVFELHDFGRYWRDHFPRDLTLRGAGKNATLLVLKQDLSAYDTVRNLTFENFTIYTNDSFLFDIRKASISVTMRSVRFAGWDMGAGGSKLFATRALALRASDCDFLGGFGRSPLRGRLFDIRSNALLARFENCTIAHTRAFGGFTSGATVVYSACRIVEATDHSRELPSSVLMDGTTLSWWDESQEVPPQRDMNEYFPGWREALSK